MIIVIIYSECGFHEEIWNFTLCQKFLRVTIIDYRVTIMPRYEIPLHIPDDVSCDMRCSSSVNHERISQFTEQMLKTKTADCSIGYHVEVAEPPETHELLKGVHLAETLVMTK